MCLASAAAEELVVVVVAAVAVAALGTRCYHQSHIPELLPVGYPVRTLVLDRFAAAGRDNQWAEVDLVNQLAAGLAVVVVVGPNVWTMTTMTVCSLSRVRV